VIHKSRVQSQPNVGMRDVKTSFFIVSTNHCTQINSADLTPHCRIFRKFVISLIVKGLNISVTQRGQISPVGTNLKLCGGQCSCLLLF